MRLSNASVARKLTENNTKAGVVVQAKVAYDATKG